MSFSTHQTGPMALQGKSVASQMPPTSAGGDSQVRVRRTETPVSEAEVLVQLLQLSNVPVLAFERLWPVRTQPYQKEGGPCPLSALVWASG